VNKRELIDAVASEVGDDVSKQDVERTVDAFTRVVGTNLRKGEPVQLVGFGTFEPRKRAQRRARNPQTGEQVKVPATTVPAFKASGPLKDYVAGKSGAAERFKGRSAAKKSTKKAGKTSAKKAGKASTKKAAKKSAKTTKSSAKTAGAKKAASKAGKKSAKKARR
jgi:DNA-binding protein HU-beta